ncbi:hypothetical protein TcasGA2_TC010014 [Tribolium castaneum]|uniref:Uncharacterized protein n=1 Tax=Tribolium castaneum TaxID=7070 RepID=D6WRA2_TRICA|nr:hypothetical protein TcasGA2_TC010014 [Tribolium castaneum]
MATIDGPPSQTIKRDCNETFRVSLLPSAMTVADEILEGCLARSSFEKERQTAECVKNEIRPIKSSEKKNRFGLHYTRNLLPNLRFHTNAQRMKRMCRETQFMQITKRIIKI